MKKIFLVLLVSILATVGYSQSVQPRGSANVTVEDARLKAKYNLVLPVFNDTTEANLWKGVDSTGALIFTRDSNSVWVRKFLPKKWVIFGNGTGGGSGGSGWQLGGNALTNAAVEYFGSSNYMDVNFGSNNLKRFSLSKDGVKPLASTAKAIGIDSLTGYLTYTSGGGSGGGTNFQANNGITRSDTTFQLGGSLITPTTISTDATNYLAITGLWPEETLGDVSVMVNAGTGQIGYSTKVINQRDSTIKYVTPTQLSSKVNISDTATMLSPYAKNLQDVLTHGNTATFNTNTFNAKFTLTNTNAGSNAAVGALYYNDLSESLQYYVGS